MNTTIHMEAERRRSYAAAAGLVLAAWAGLAAWGISPYAQWLDHARMEHIPAPVHVRLAVFALGWTLMVIAMMLPATLLLARRQNYPLHLRRLAPLILPYLGVWLVFGVLCYIGDGLLHEVIEHSPMWAGMIAPGTLLLAGIYQFTPLKHFFLSRCDTFGAAFDQERASGRSQWALGLRHGLLCLGSCWALMLLMFTLGGVNVIWMLVLGLVMTAEPLVMQLRAGLTQVLGGVLVLAAVAALA